MNAETLKGVNKALNQATTNGIEVVEIWLGPSDFEANKDSFRKEGDKLFYNDLRVRRMAEDQIPRVGETTCGEGPGVT